MSVVERILDASDQTFAPRDALALLAFIVDGHGASGYEIRNVAGDLGLSVTVPYSPETHPDLEDCLPGDTVTTFSDAFQVALRIGRERLAERFPRKAN